MKPTEVLIVEKRSALRVSGGYRYNDAVAREFRRRGVGGLAVVDRAEDLPDLAAQVLLIDSLLLDAPLPEAVAEALAARSCRLYILGHFFPPASPSLTKAEKATWVMSAQSWVRAAQGVAVTGYAALPLWQRGFPDANFEIIPPAIVHRRRRTPPRNRPTKLITLGAITRDKLPLPLLRNVLDTTDGCDLIWHIVGSQIADPQHVARTRDLIQDHSRRDCVMLRDAIAPSKTRGMLAGADIYLATSQFESFAMAAAEALAVGLPVVSFDVGDVRRWLSPEGGADLVTVGDFDTFAARVRALVNPSTACTLSGHHAILPQTRWRNVGDQFQTYLNGAPSS